MWYTNLSSQCSHGVELCISDIGIVKIFRQIAVEIILGTFPREGICACVLSRGDGVVLYEVMQKRLC